MRGVELRCVFAWVYASVRGVTDFSGLAPDPHVVCARVAPLVGRPSAGMRRPYARNANLFRMCWAGLSRLYPIRLVQRDNNLDILTYVRYLARLYLCSGKALLRASSASQTSRYDSYKVARFRRSLHKGTAT